MISVLRQELAFNAHKQLIATLLFIVIGSIVLETLPLGFNDTSMGIYRLLCAGYGLYAVSNTIMLILLYFEDYTGALAATGVFAASVLRRPSGRSCLERSTILALGSFWEAWDSIWSAGSPGMVHETTSLFPAGAQGTDRE